MRSIVIGSAFLELVPNMRGGLDEVSLRAYPGGSATNIAVAMAKFGIEVSLLTKVGEDEVGDFILRFLRDRGVDVRRVEKIEGYRTGLGFYLYMPRKRYYFYRFAGYSKPEERISLEDFMGNVENYDVVSITEAVVRVGDVGVRMAEEARRRGVRVFYEPNFRRSLIRDISRFRDRLKRLLNHVDIVFPNEEEVEVISGEKKVERGVKRILELGPEIVVVKRGKKGCVVHDGRKMEVVEGWRVKVGDDTGAGDVFHAAFTYSFLRWGEPCVAARFANAAAALRIRGGAYMESIPSVEEVERFMEGCTSL